MKEDQVLKKTKVKCSESGQNTETILGTQKRSPKKLITVSFLRYCSIYLLQIGEGRYIYKFIY